MFPIEIKKKCKFEKNETKLWCLFLFFSQWWIKIINLNNNDVYFLQVHATQRNEIKCTRKSEEREREWEKDKVKLYMIKINGWKKTFFLIEWGLDQRFSINVFMFRIFHELLLMQLFLKLIDIVLLTLTAKNRSIFDWLRIINRYYVSKPTADNISNKFNYLYRQLNFQFFECSIKCKRNRVNFFIPVWCGGLQNFIRYQ